MENSPWNRFIEVTRHAQNVLMVVKNLERLVFAFETKNTGSLFRFFSTSLPIADTIEIWKVPSAWPRC